MKPKAFWFCLCGFLFSIIFQVVGTLLLYQRAPSAYLALDNRTLITVTSTSACLYLCVKYVFTRAPPVPEPRHPPPGRTDLWYILTGGYGHPANAPASYRPA